MSCPPGYQPYELQCCVPDTLGFATNVCTPISPQDDCPADYPYFTSYNEALGMCCNTQNPTHLSQCLE